MCRRRKLKCVREKEQARCVLCSFHQRECTYLDAPQQRRRRRKRAVVGTETGNNAGSNSDDHNRKRTRTRARAGTAAAASGPAGDLQTSRDPGLARLSLTLGLHPTTHFKYIGPGSLHEDMLLDFIDPSFRYHNETDASKFCRLAEGMTFLARPDSTAAFNADDDDDTEAVERLVRPHGPGLVDLYFRIVHPSYPILHKHVFLDRYQHGRRGGGGNTTRNSTANTSSSGNPSYKAFPAPLLAAVYLLALDWWDYDQELALLNDARAAKAKPDGEALARVAMRALMAVVHRPKLSTVQACLLLLQQRGGRSAATTVAGGDSWVLTSQLVAVAEELGLHVDCTTWNIPTWEKGLRRRLAWATFMQDKWSSLIYGRPSHVQSSHWRIPPLSLDDFREDMDEGVEGRGIEGRSSNNDNENENGDGVEADGDAESPYSSYFAFDGHDSAEVNKGRLLFIHLARLTEVMAEALATFYSHDPVRYQAFSEADGMHTVELVKSVALRLRAWATGLPSCLRMEAVRPRKLCSNGYLHLSYFVTEIMIYRCIVRSLARQPSDVAIAHDAQTTTLVNICREAAKTRLLHVMRFVEALRPEHLQAFWWFASAKSLAYIRTYVSLLWATSRGELEADYYRQKLDEFRWSLRVRARGVAFVTAALREMGETLEDIDMSRPPFEQLDEQKRQRLRGSASTAVGVMAAPVAIFPSMPPTGVMVPTAQVLQRVSAAQAAQAEQDTHAHAVYAAQVSHAVQAAQVAQFMETPDEDDGLDDEENATESLDDMALQTTPEFLADFGVAASEAFFADINSLHLYALNTQ